MSSEAHKHLDELLKENAWLKDSLVRARILLRRTIRDLCPEGELDAKTNEWWDDIDILLAFTGSLDKEKDPEEEIWNRTIQGECGEPGRIPPSLSTGDMTPGG
jgi:hypothetical protein